MAIFVSIRSLTDQKLRPYSAQDGDISIVASGPRVVALRGGAILPRYRVPIAITSAHIGIAGVPLEFRAALRLVLGRFRPAWQTETENLRESRL